MKYEVFLYRSSQASSIHEALKYGAVRKLDDIDNDIKLLDILLAIREAITCFQSDGDKDLMIALAEENEKHLFGPKTIADMIFYIVRFPEEFK